MAGRLKEDVVSVEGRWWERRVGLVCSWSGLPSPFSAARAERQAAEVGGKGGEWAGHFVIRLE